MEGEWRCLDEDAGAVVGGGGGGGGLVLMGLENEGEVAAVGEWWWMGVRGMVGVRSAVGGLGRLGWWGRLRFVLKDGWR